MKKTNTTKTAIICTAAILAAIAISTYIIYDQIHPVKCKSEIVKETRWLPDDTVDYICEEGVEVGWISGRIYSGTCYAKTRTCWRE